MTKRWQKKKIIGYYFYFILKLSSAFNWPVNTVDGKLIQVEG